MNNKYHLYESVEMNEPDWQSIARAPFDCDLELAVIENGEVHRLITRCRRSPSGWISAASGKPLDIHPTHWRHWRPEAARGGSCAP